ncbi:MAG: CPBP family intramembrane glutamic endopeptidase [Bacteroidia bacterium]
MISKNLSPQLKGIILFSYLVLVIVITALGGGEDVNKIDLTNPSTILLLKLSQMVSVLILFIIPTVLFILFSSEKKLSYLKLNGFNFNSGIAVILLVFAVMPFINWTGELNSHLSLPSFMSGIEEWMKASEDNLKKLTDIFLKMDTVGDLILNTVVIALFAAVGEELFFRGAIQNVLIEWTKKTHLSVWITAILFSALHAQFYGFIPRMLLGVVLGYIYIWSGSLWLSMLFHFLNNGLAVLFSYLIGKGKISETAETVGAGDTPIYFVIVSVFVSAGLMYFIYKNKTESQTLNP